MLIICPETSGPMVLYNNIGSIPELEKYLKESCFFISDQHFFFKYFLKISFVKQIGMKGLTLMLLSC